MRVVIAAESGRLRQGLRTMLVSLLDSVAPSLLLHAARLRRDVSAKQSQKADVPDG